ncbi:hypothetical protein [Nocardioides sp.]|uniref:hypothetical protein n=1 Tax=Nocardioides sp. TaxID=35761 RepID=UPI0027360AC8|nr:hypothetical protein [Nocardioides sp.]MDP3892279.1 hypothetical protein [Nocardioides sp.]
MSTHTVPGYSTRELQAAAQALAAGQFATATAATQDETRIVVLEESRAAVVEASGATVTEPAAAPRADVAGTSGLAPLVRVRAANAGAGASTIALALAEVADVAGVRTRVIDAAAPAWSGLLGATVTELGAAEGWRRGRRGQAALIDRIEDAVRVPSDVPSPRSADGVDLTVLDAGWSMRELAAASTGWVATAAAHAEVLVTRPTALALSQTEAALRHLEDQVVADQVVVVVVGAGRWSDREFATAGRLLRRAHELEAVLFAPVLPAKTLPGLGPDPLPKQLTSPSQRLLERITTITGPLRANRI